MLVDRLSWNLTPNKSTGSLIQMTQDNIYGMNQINVPAHLSHCEEGALSAQRSIQGGQTSTSRSQAKGFCSSVVELYTGVKHVKFSCAVELGAINVLRDIIQTFNFGDNSLNHRPGL